ncbi:cyclin-like protein [Panaeolus papilionaceus]|nr:cyclin-like protein [Panaeolus papilionaceus]
MDATLNEEVSSSQHNKSLYEASTQYTNWRFSQEDLARIRTSLNVAAISAIQSTLEKAEPGSSQGVSFLDAAEENLLVKQYIVKISEVCGAFQYPEEVEATAITYLKRFYLKNTVMDWHPMRVMLTTIFLATKTTNNPVVLEEYASRIPKTTPNDILELEFLIAQSLGFEFSVWHAHRALWGIWLDIQSLPDTAQSYPQSIYATAMDHVRASRLTDAELLYTPSQIALSALSLVLPEAASQWISRRAPEQANSLAGLIENIKQLINTHGRPPAMDYVRELDRRLKLCKNPEKVVGSKAYLLRKEREEKLAESKRLQKAAESQRAMSGDPFGTEIGQNKRTGGLVDYDDDDDDDDD